MKIKESLITVVGLGVFLLFCVALWLITEQL